MWSLVRSFPNTHRDKKKVGHSLIFEICFPLLLFIGCRTSRKTLNIHISTPHHITIIHLKECPNLVYLVVRHNQNFCHSKGGHKLSPRGEHRRKRCWRVVRLLAPPSESIPAYRNSMAHCPGPFVYHANGRTGNKNCYRSPSERYLIIKWWLRLSFIKCFFNIATNLLLAQVSIALITRSCHVWTLLGVD